MPPDSTGRAFSPEDVDFEAFYQGQPTVKDVRGTFDFAPWDLGEPQPEVVRLAERGELRSDVLDAGCGLGENALFLAEQGYRVTGFDAAPTALAKATGRAQQRGLDVEFVAADATRLDEFSQRFSTVLDSALYHCLTEEQQREYVAALHRVTLPGARLHMFCFSDSEPHGLRLPMAISKQNLRDHLGRHWNILDLRSTYYATAFTEEYVRGMDQAMFDQLGIEIDLDVARTDERGRITGSVWYVHAERA